MKILITTALMILSVEVFSQQKPIHKTIPIVREQMWIIPNPNIGKGLYFTPYLPDSVMNIMVNPIEMNWLFIKPFNYNFFFNGIFQSQRRSDTLIVHDKSVRFIVIDSVTYELPIIKK